MPESFAILWGSMESSWQALTMAPLMESWPQPAQSVEIDPS